MDPQVPPSEGGHGQPFEYTNSSNRSYYTFVIILLVIVTIAGVGFIAISKFTKSLNTTLKTSVAVKQSSYENPFVTTQAKTYDNPFDSTASVAGDSSYENPFK